jgi:lipopolysaccharide biosynthesis protein
MNQIKPIVIYYPQYHVIPENEHIWGANFTDWTNVKKAKPLFNNHYQPHIPHSSIGYYDLSDPNVLIKQAELASQYGIYGFAYYHYWFNGKRLLNKPLDNMLNLKSPKFPFIYIWANEPWTINWDGNIRGKPSEIIQQQNFSDDDNIEHMTFLCNNVFNDERYITIDDKPVFIVYRTKILPNVKKTADTWRTIAKKFGFKDLFLIKINSFGDRTNAKDIGFDSSMEFSPDINFINNLHPVKTLPRVYNYKKCILSTLQCDKAWKESIIRTICPSWDNSARRGNRSVILNDIDVQTFEYAMKYIINYTLQKHNHGMFFINAWNEWAEGCHIEPDEKNGFLYLETIKNILSDYNH